MYFINRYYFLQTTLVKVSGSKKDLYEETTIDSTKDARDVLDIRHRHFPSLLHAEPVESILGHSRQLSRLE